MRRTVPKIMTLACTAVLVSAVPAFADGVSATPSASPTRASSAAPTEKPGVEPSRGTGVRPTRAPAPSGVSVVPSGAPDTGVRAASGSGTEGGLIGGAAAAVLLAGGGAVLVVRRRRATGA